MKKALILFVIFLIAFGAALGFIYYAANPVARLSDEASVLPWNGRVENEFGTYNGSLVGDLFSGNGNFSFLTGESYTGEWKDSYMSGEGTTVFPGIGEYSGEMSSSKRNGQGTFIWKTGDKYTGHWSNDTMSGQGRYTFANGDFFEGEFSENKPISGKYTCNRKLPSNADDTEIVSFVYTFSNNEKHLVFTTKGGLKYDGDASGLVSNGNAIITYPSGNTYNGQLVNGQREGTGKYTWVNERGKTTAYYEGSWNADHMNGEGKYHYSNSEYPYLSGKFVDDTPVGTLTYYKAAGNTFETKWENGVCVSIKET